MEHPPHHPSSNIPLREHRLTMETAPQHPEKQEKRDALRQVESQIPNPFHGFGWRPEQWQEWLSKAAERMTKEERERFDRLALRYGTTQERLEQHWKLEIQRGVATPNILHQKDLSQWARQEQRLNPEEGKRLESLRLHANDVLHSRYEIVRSTLSAMGEIEGGSAFEEERTEEKVKELEKKVYNLPDPEDEDAPRNPLFVKGNPYLSNFASLRGEIATLEPLLDRPERKQIGMGIERDGEGKQDPATVQRIERLIDGLHLLRFLDLYGTVRYEIQKAREQSSYLATPARLAALVALSVLATMSALPVLRKMWKREPLGPQDLIVVAYLTGIGAVIKGRLPFTGEEPYAKEGAEIGYTLGEERVQEALSKMKQEEAQNFLSNFESSYALPEQLQELRKALETRDERFLKKHLEARAGKKLEELMDEDTSTEAMLLRMFQHPDLTPKDLRALFSAFSRIDLTREGRAEILHNTLNNPVLYAK